MCADDEKPQTSATFSGILFFNSVKDAAQWNENFKLQTAATAFRESTANT